MDGLMWKSDLTWKPRVRREQVDSDLLWEPEFEPQRRQKRWMRKRRKRDWWEQESWEERRKREKREERQRHWKLLRRDLREELRERLGLQYLTVARTKVVDIGRTVKRSLRPKLHRSPGFKLLALAEFLFSRKIYKKVLQPIIRDLQDEHLEALAAHRLWKARYVRLRGYCAFWSAVWAQFSGSLVRKLLKALGVGMSSPS